jgi:hypothetical protein
MPIFDGVVFVLKTEWFFSSGPPNHLLMLLMPKNPVFEVRRLPDLSAKLMTESRCGAFFKIYSYFLVGISSLCTKTSCSDVRDALTWLSRRAPTYTLKRSSFFKQGNTLRSHNLSSVNLIINTITMKLAILVTLFASASAFSVGKVRTYLSVA